MNAILEDKNPLDYVEEDFEIIALHATDREYGKLAKQEKKCKSILIKHIGDDQLEYVKDKSTTKDIYDKLQEIYERKSISGQILLRRKLINMKYNDGENMKDYLLKFDKTIRDLKLTGAKPEETDIVCQLLVTLPKSFDPLVTALETLNPKTLTMDLARSRMSRRECKNTNSQVSSEYQVAMNASQLVCYNCCKNGHKRYDCPNTTRYRFPMQANVVKEEEENGHNYRTLNQANYVRDAKDNYPL